jgi:anti-anti-sigma factor
MLKVHARKLGNVAVVGLVGQLVNGETEPLRRTVNSLSEISSVKLDLARVTTIDAGGLGVMLALREQTESKGIRFELINVTLRAAMLLHLTRLDTVFRITPAVEYLPPVSLKRRKSMTRLASCA